jgi:hypothetical protein
MLFLHVRETKSLQNVKRVNEIKCQSFKESVRTRNLLGGDKEWFKFNEEATGVL